nr:hypothetical protein Iba_chr05cCG19450 [Ipomoea batatas]
MPLRSNFCISIALDCAFNACPPPSSSSKSAVLAAESCTPTCSVTGNTLIVRPAISSFPFKLCAALACSS